ncbi:MAG: T9SS type A sorting domain-containing protein [Flavipsychrobacter sp.]
MKTLITVIAMFIASINFASAQTSIVIPFDLNNVNVDGQINASEWQDADSVFIVMSNNDSITVYYKHDMQNVYFAFAGKLESHSVSQIFPEVLLDPQNKKGSNWVAGQWWFHVSAQDCENDGGYGVYNNCNVSQTSWTGVPNFTPGPPYTDSVEIKIPYNKLNFNAVTQSVMGLAFVLTNTNNIYQMWPSAADRNVPSTWSTATINKFPVDVKTITNDPTVKCYPNPATDVLHIEGVQQNDPILLINVYGSIVSKGVASGNTYQMDIAQLPSGIYYLSTGHDSNRVTQKVVVNK